MKTVLITLALLLAACGGSSPKTNDMAFTPDLTAPADFTVPPDLAQLSCRQTVACVTSCTGASFNACVEGCLANASTNALVSFAPLEMCAEPACYDADGGSDACGSVGSGACLSCITTNCSSQYTTCEAN